MKANTLQDVESLLYTKQIESHQSQFANFRQHLIEVAIDQKRALVREDPTIDNLIGYWGAMESLFSYIQSLRQPGDPRKKSDAPKPQIDGMIEQLEQISAEMSQYWSFMKFGLCDRETTPVVFRLKAKFPKDYNLRINARMVQLCNAFADRLRIAYQSMRYYYREGRVRVNVGLEGDLMRAKVNRAKGKKEDTDELGDVESEG